jgi:hypothetical protein
MVVRANGNRGAGNSGSHGSTETPSAAAYARDLGLSPVEGKRRVTAIMRSPSYGTTSCPLQKA